MGRNFSMVFEFFDVLRYVEGFMLYVRLRVILQEKNNKKHFKLQVIFYLSTKVNARECFSTTKENTEEIAENDI